MHFKSFLTIGLAFLITACGGSSKLASPVKNVSEIPSWVDQPESLFPNSLYLASVGVADSKYMAEMNAYNSIAHMFEVTIEGSETLTSNIKETFNSAGSELSESAELVRRITAKTGQKLVNTQIEKTHYDRKSNKFYVLAAMNKQKTAEIYSAQLKSNKNKITEWQSALEKESDNLNKLAFIHKVQSLIKLSEALQSSLKILDFFEDQTDFSGQYTTLTQQKNELLQNVQVYLVANETVSASTKSLVKQKINEAGFRLSEEKQTATLIVECHFHSEETTLKGREDQKFIVWNFEAQIKKAGSNSNLSVFTKKDRTGQLTLDAAKQKAVHKAEDEISKHFTTFFQNTVFNL